MEDVFICSSCRTTIGKVSGHHSKIPAIKLGSAVLTKCMEQINIEPENISQVIIGQVFTAGHGQNPARQTAMLSKLPVEIPAYTVNMLGGSSLKAVYEAYNSIRSGDSSVVFAGGQENMTLANHSANLRLKEVIGHIEWKDTTINDGLTDAFLGLQMGNIANHLANAFKVSRELQDKFSLMSQTRAIKAIDNEYFYREIIPVMDQIDLTIDECPWRNINLDYLSSLPSAYSEENGTITVGNSAVMSDGAAGVLIVNGTEVKKRNIFPQVRIVAIAQIGCEPIEMGLASIAAIQSVVEKADWSLNAVDLFEIDESFAVQAMLCIDTLNLDLEKVNICGGAIALGNPLGATGVRLLVTLIHNLKRLNKSKGIVVMCIGGGMGIAIAIERHKF